jgi:hypothetical protein
MKFNEYDVVKTLVDKDSVPAGTVGTIVCVFTDPREAYMVELADGDGRTLDTPIYQPDELIKE